MTEQRCNTLAQTLQQTFHKKQINEQPADNVVAQQFVS